MESIERKKLAEEMYSVANEIVGNVGPKIDKTFARDFTEFIVSFIIDRDELNTDEIIATWTKWINSYCIFAKYSVPETLLILDNPDIVVRWLLPPRIYKDGLTWNGELIPYPKKYRITAYLAIVRSDYDYRHPGLKDADYTLTLGRESIHHFLP